MLSIRIEPRLVIEDATGRGLGTRVVELLLQVDRHGSLAAACAASGLSYRHAWELLREGEALFGQPLLVKARGKGSTLAVLGERLVLAQRRIQARLSPALDSLASELGPEIERLMRAGPLGLRIWASHGFAVQALHEAMAREGVPHELRYCSSAEALEALADGQCDVAGFHLPLGEHEAATVAHYRRWLDPRSQRVIRLATRRQGLMTAPGNPRKIYEVADLARPGIRFINRQAGSGTRFLLDQLLRARGLAPASIAGYEQCEYTHAAVAAFVASGMADVGMGLEPPARQFRLEFVPLQTERYKLLCRADRTDAPAVQQAVGILRGEPFHRAIDALAGYAVDETGRVEPLEAVVPGLGEAKRTRPAAARRGALPSGAG